MMKSNWFDQFSIRNVEICLILDLFYYFWLKFDQNVDEKIKNCKNWLKMVKINLKVDIFEIFN